MCPDSADKEKARRDEAAFHLVSQWMLFHESTENKMRTLTSKMSMTCTPNEVRRRIADVNTTVNEADGMGIVDPEYPAGILFFTYLARLKKIRDCDGFFIPYVNDLLSNIETCLQMCAARIANWEFTLSGKTIEKSLEHSNVYVEDAKVPLSKKHEDGEERDEGD